MTYFSILLPKEGGRKKTFFAIHMKCPKGGIKIDFF